MTEKVQAAPSMTVALDQKQVAKMQASVPTVLSQAKELVVENTEEYLESSSLLDVVIARQGEVSALFDKAVKDANNVHKFLTGLRNGLLLPLKQAENMIRQRRQDFRAKAEQKRLERESKARDTAKKEQDTHAVEEASQLEAIGEDEAANFVIERAANAPPPPVIVPSAIPKEKGKSIRKVNRFRIVNESLIKREFLSPDETKINAVVSKLGSDAVSIVGGIEVYKEEIETIRRAKGEPYAGEGESSGVQGSANSGS